MAIIRTEVGDAEGVAFAVSFDASRGASANWAPGTGSGSLVEDGLSMAAPELQGWLLRTASFDGRGW